MPRTLVVGMPEPRRIAARLPKRRRLKLRSPSTSPRWLSSSRRPLTLTLKMTTLIWRRYKRWKNKSKTWMIKMSPYTSMKRSSSDLISIAPCTTSGKTRTLSNRNPMSPKKTLVYLNCVVKSRSPPLVSLDLTKITLRSKRPTICSTKG